MGYFSELWKVKLSDWERGLIVAIFSLPLGILFDWATTEGYNINWRSMAKGAVVGFLAYIGKNFSTGKNGNLLTNSDKSLITGKTAKDVCAKMIPFLILPALIFGSMTFQACPAVQIGGQVAEPWQTQYTKWTSYQRADFFMELWMVQEADYKAMNAYPNKTEALISALKAKRELLEQSRLPMRTYATLVKSGGTPDAATEKQIVEWLTQLQMNLLTAGGK